MYDRNSNSYGDYCDTASHDHIDGDTTFTNTPYHDPNQNIWAVLVTTTGLVMTTRNPSSTVHW